MQRNKLR